MSRQPGTDIEPAAPERPGQTALHEYLLLVPRFIQLSTAFIPARLKKRFGSR